jgi:outer membrane protein assembly factor BamA
MGGDVGFRGYETSSFTGNKSLLFNLEFRNRLPSKWSKVAIGQAFFADSGFAWKKGEDMRFQDLKFNVGWGLRFDIPSIFGKDILRFDLAVATDTGDILTSIVLGQVFRYNELTENTQKEF